MSWLSNLFTPTNSSVDQSIWNNQQSDQNQLNTLLPGEVNYEQELQQLRQQNLPALTNAIQGLLNFTTQGGRNSLVQSFGQNERAGAQDAGANASATWAGNPGLATAAKLGDMNDANAATAQYSQGINSPQGQEQALQAALQAANSMNPNYSGAGGIVGSQFNEPIPPQYGGAGSIMGLLGNLAGGGVFSGLANMFNGKGSGGGNSGMQPTQPVAGAFGGTR